MINNLSLILQSVTVIIKVGPKLHSAYGCLICLIFLSLDKHFKQILRGINQLVSLIFIDVLFSVPKYVILLEFMLSLFAF